MTDQPLHIAILEGTTRPQRLSMHAAKLVEEVGRGIAGIEVRLVDPTQYNFPGDGNDPEGKDARYTELTAWADGFFIVTPEYNHSIPGSLKRMLDSELDNYVHKPVAFAGVSNSRFGGVRAIEALNTTARELGLASCFTDAHFPRVQDLFNDRGELQDPVFRDIVAKAYAELIWMATTLKWGRDNLPRA